MSKIDELVKREISREILQLCAGEFVSVTAVEVSRDLSFAKVWINALGDAEKIRDLCQKHAAEITHSLAGRIKIKRVPQLRFYIDKSAGHAEKIEALVDQIKRERGE